MEIAQEAFYRAFVKQNELRDEDKFLPWVTTIAMYHGYRQAKLDAQRYNQLPLDDMMMEALFMNADDAFPIDESPMAETTLRIRRWIMTLHETDQNLFMMKHYQYMTFKEISEQMHMPLSTVKRRIGKMNAQLKTALMQERDEAA